NGDPASPTQNAKRADHCGLVHLQLRGDVGQRWPSVSPLGVLMLPEGEDLPANSLCVVGRVAPKRLPAAWRSAGAIHGSAELRCGHRPPRNGRFRYLRVASAALIYSKMSAICRAASHTWLAKRR